MGEKSTKEPRAPPLSQPPSRNKYQTQDSQIAKTLNLCPGAQPADPYSITSVKQLTTRDQTAHNISSSHLRPHHPRQNTRRRCLRGPTWRGPGTAPHVWDTDPVCLGEKITDHDCIPGLRVENQISKECFCAFDLPMFS